MVVDYNVCLHALFWDEHGCALRSTSILGKFDAIFKFLVKKARVCWKQHNSARISTTVLPNSMVVLFIKVHFLLFFFPGLFPSIDFEVLPNINLHKNMSSANKFNEKHGKLGQNMVFKLSQVMVYQCATKRTN